MKLSKILDKKIDNDIEIEGITINSKEVKPNYLFVAIKGYVNDGHNYIEEAFNKGASAIIVNNDRYDEFKDLGYIIPVDNTREICSKIACNFYDNPSKSFKLIGITGTKGKTSTAFMIRDMLYKSGKKVGLISTIATYIDKEKIFDNDRTTPDPFTLQKTFDLMRNKNCEYVVMEVSSQSLKLGRVDNTYFDYGMFLNLSEEHVSRYEHKDLNEYFLCKSMLFDMVKIGFTNIDDKKGRELIELKPNCKFTEISLDQASSITLKEYYTSFKTNIYNAEEEIKLPIIGKYAIYNALFTIRLGEMLNIDKYSIIESLQKVRIPGRCEFISNNLGLNIIIDFAHNAKSLRSILESLKMICKGRIITVFGCAGDRGKAKRKEMGMISGKLSDYTIISSDNPASEDPNVICAEIEAGIKDITNNYEIIIDREKAIKKAVKIANKDDIILLAGKGHETYQIIGDKKIPFSEKEIIKGLE